MTCTRSEDGRAWSRVEPLGFVRDRALVLAGSVATFAAARVYAPHVHAGPVLCPMRGLFGLPCPGCGLTRAMCALSQGEVLAALSWNACALPLALLMLAASVVAAGELVRGARWEFYRRALYSMKVAYWAGGAVALYHAARCCYWAYSGTLFEAPVWFSTTWPSAAS